MAQQFGGQVSGSDLREFGHAEVRGESDNVYRYASQVQGGQNVWMSHGDKVTELAGLCLYSESRCVHCRYGAHRKANVWCSSTRK